MEPKTVLVTGANRGLGLEFVKQFSKLKKPPVHIFAGCRDPDKAEDLKKISKEFASVKILKMDMSNLETVAKAAAEVDKIAGSTGLNLLVNNAGILVTDNLSQVTPETMVESYRVNVVAPTVVVQKFVPLLKKAAQSSSLKGQSCNRAMILNMSSWAGSVADSDQTGRMYPYKQSKAALNMTTKMLAYDLKSDNILVMSFCPGWVQTSMGGADAALTPQQSISGILKIVSEVNEKDSGTFRRSDGSVLPW